MTAYRTGGTTGVIYLSSSGSHYLYWDGTNYNLNSGNLICTGNITAYSDETLKTDWRDLPEDFLAQLAGLKHGIYTRIDSGDDQAGISAQKLQVFLPQVVQKDEKGKLSVAYGNAAMVSAVQLAKRVVEQDERIAKLEALVAKLTEGK
jgi:methanogenic corrinoid protein MtbC1